jgi:hypothetical protein
MANRLWGEISIPTHLITSELLNILLTEVDSYSFYNRREDDGITVVDYGEARSGEFERTEQYCREHGIPYDRRSEAGIDFPAEIVYYRPAVVGKADKEKDQCIRIPVDYQWSPYLDVDFIRQILDSQISDADKLSQIRDLINQHCPKVARLETYVPEGA